MNMEASVKKEQPSFLKEKEELESLLKNLVERNFSERLELKPHPTEEEIKKSFRNKAILFHPDNKPDELKDLYDRILRLYSEAKNSLIDNHRDIKQNNKEYNKPFSKEESYEIKREKIYEDIENNLFLFNIKGFKKQKVLWINTGLVTAEEINNLKNVKDYAIKDILKNLDYSGFEVFIVTRDEWIEEGVIKKEEINNLKIVKDYAIKELKRILSNRGIPVFRVQREKWVNEGIITSKEADDIEKTADF